ncbi:hypothetical protein HY489_04430 [Candidatus Woesearchaeota archaeon]|nr:hypothetical protein [Candidatus Woesearchaeota archaeon]
MDQLTICITGENIDGARCYFARFSPSLEGPISLGGTYGPSPAAALLEALVAIELQKPKAIKVIVPEEYLSSTRVHSAYGPRGHEDFASAHICPIEHLLHLYQRSTNITTTLQRKRNTSFAEST